MKSFLQRFATSIHGALSGFDRVRFRGTQRLLASFRGLTRFLAFHGVRYKDFADFAETTTERIKADVRQQAETLGRPVRYLNNSQQSKEEVALEMARQYGVREGLIGILSAVEPCRSFTVGPNRQKKELELRVRPSKCLHYYHYWMDPAFGLCHVRLQTWLPFNVFVCVNGREMLARQLDREGIGYVKRDNCFAEVADLERTQALADAQVRLDWATELEKRLTASHPHWRSWPGMDRPYYWSAEEVEWATDVMFRSRQGLAAVMPRFVRHGIEVLRSGDVMRFLGRHVPAHGGVHGQFLGTVETRYQERPEGVRVKHSLNRNGIKMYDKQGTVLRVEVTSNDARDLKTFRAKETDPDGPKAWLPLRKGVADLPRRAEVSQKGTERYLESLATVEDTQPLGELTDRVSRRKTWKRRPVRALNLLAAEDLALLQAVGRGEFLLNGFRNRDLRGLLYPKPAAEAAEAKRRSAAVTRQLRLLRAHGLIGKVAHTHRYQLSAFGRTLLTALQTARTADTTKLQAVG